MRTRASANNPPSLPKSRNTGVDGDPSRPRHEDRGTETSQDNKLQAPEQSPPLTHARVLGRYMMAPTTYDPDTYDPNAPPSRTPEPEPHTPESYAVWGRERFGEEWYELRETMLRERNI